MRQDTEVDLLGGGVDDARAFGSQIERGTVGFAKDQSDADCLEAGDGSAGEAGITLLHVTLYTGRGLAQRPKPGQAQGREVLVQLGWPLHYPPPRGMQVICAFPGGDLSPGNGVLLQCIAPASKTQFAAGRATLDCGPTISLTIKGEWVTIKAQEDLDGEFGPWIGVGPVAGGTTGVYMQDGSGGGCQAAGGEFFAMASDGSQNEVAKLSLTETLAQLTLAQVGVVSLDVNGLTLHSETTVTFLGITFAFGAAPTLPALAGLTGMAGAPVPNVLFAVA
ncbi:MAG TPA: hypothetical protein VGI39_39785 [Polyangiaceae bacterium]|jgi:hypothetical protein